MNPFDPGYYISDQLRSFGFSRVGEDCVVSRNCTIIGLENITIGDHVRIDGYTTIISNNGLVSIGSHVHICSGCVIGGRGGVVLEDFSSLSHGAKLLSATDDFSGHYMTNSTLPEHVLGVKIAPIKVGKYVPVGAGTLLLPGSDIGEGTAVNAHSVVTGVLPPWMICGGNPAMPLIARSQALLDRVARLTHSID